MDYRNEDENSWMVHRMIAIKNIDDIFMNNATYKNNQFELFDGK